MHVLLMMELVGARATHDGVSWCTYTIDFDWGIRMSGQSEFWLANIG